MSATVRIVSLTGVEPGTPTVVAARRYSTTDSNDPGLAYANQVPEIGSTNDSYWTHVGLEILDTTTFSRLSNFRWFGPAGGISTPWGLGSGKLQVAMRDTGDHGCPYSEYQQAGGVEGEYGTPIKDSVAGHSYYKGQTAALANADSFTPTSPLVFDSSVKVFADAPCYTRFVVSSLQVAADTQFGEKATLYCGFRWQEI